MGDLIPAVRGIEALRNSFGDGKPPEISRKITACVACRRQKIKCHMVNGKAPCTRCKSRSLPCTVNRSLQMLMEEDVTWKQGVTKQLQVLQGALCCLADKLNMPELESAIQEGADLDQIISGRKNENPASKPDETSPAQPNSRSWEVDMQCEPSSMPASVMVEVQDAAPEVQRSSERPNLISKGVVKTEEAEKLFTLYRDRMDHLLYRILADNATLDTVLESSPLLAAATCTVGALHSTELGHLYEPCLSELQHLVSYESLSGKHNMDDVRGLCIGGFWLNSLSWALSGCAVRISAEIGLHSAIYRALEGEKDAYMKTRLYYHVFVCDHHSSVIYGRPPLTRESPSTRAAMKLLETENATEDDVRLVTQVMLWSVYSEISDCFGTETRNALSSTQLVQLRRFGIRLDTWYADWKDRFGPNQRVGNYPAKGVGLHFYFARLYLCSHAFRGLEAATLQTLLPEQEEVANSAILSAMSILNILISDVEMQQHLNGLPLLFDMMITFAVVFLMKVATKYQGTVWMDKVRILSTVENIVGILQDLTKTMHAKHLLTTATAGLGSFRQKARDGRSEHTDLVPARPLSPGPSPPRDGAAIEIPQVENFENFDFHALLSDPSYWTVDLDFSN